MNMDEAEDGRDSLQNGIGTGGRYAVIRFHHCRHHTGKIARAHPYAFLQWSTVRVPFIFLGQ